MDKNFDILAYLMGKAAGGGGGGGGDNNLGIATITFVNNSSDDISMSWPTIYEDNELGPGVSAMIFDSCWAAAGTTAQFKLPMYKGKLVVEPWTAYDAYIVSFSGSVEYDAGNFVLTITGDGTITIEDN